MKNLYDLLGARPDDDAENLRKAYRKAAKASHPDRHGGDQDAAARFRQIAEAYNIPRDAEQRAAYDRLLEFERGPFRYKLKQAMSDLKRHVAHDVMAGVILAIVLAGAMSCSFALRRRPSMKQPDFRAGWDRRRPRDSAKRRGARQP